MLRILFRRTKFNPRNSGNGGVSEHWFRHHFLSYKLDLFVSLVINFIPSGLWQLKMLFTDSRMNFKTPFSRIVKLKIPYTFV